MPGPARFLAGLIELIALALAGWIALDSVTGDSSWLGYVIIAGLLFAAF